MSGLPRGLLRSFERVISHLTNFLRRRKLGKYNDAPSVSSLKMAMFFLSHSQARRTTLTCRQQVKPSYRSTLRSLYTRVPTGCHIFDT
jgi:hypothetical protein